MRRLTFILVALMAIAIVGCNKEDNPNNEAIGFYYSVVDYDDYSDNAIMKLYKGNQLLYELPRSSSVIVKGNAVYAAVREEASPFWKLYLWKNGGRLFELPAQDVFPAGWSGGCNLCLDGENIITTCTERIPSGEENRYYGIGKVWKNNQLLYTLELPDSARYTWPVKPLAVGNDIYVAGHFTKNNYQAAVWKNTEIVFMSEGYHWDGMYGVGFYNGSLYYYGTDGSNVHGGGQHGKIWKDGEVICDTKEKDWAYYGVIRDAIIWQGDVYAAGYIETDSGQESDEGNTGRIGAVWKNGEILYEFAERYLPMSSYLYSGDTRSWVELNSINIIDGDVFVSGHVYGNSSGLNVAKIWKNGVEYQGINEGIYGPGMTVTLLKNGMMYQDQF